MNPMVKYFVVVMVVLGALMSAYFKGTRDVHAEWDLADAKIAEANAKRQAKSGKANVIILTKYVDRIKVIEKEGEKVTVVIDRLVPTGQATNGFVAVHDAAAKNSAVGLDTVKTPTEDSVYSLNTAAKVVDENYRQYHRCVAQVESWKQWYKDQKKIFDEKE